MVFLGFIYIYLHLDIMLEILDCNVEIHENGMFVCGIIIWKMIAGSGVVKPIEIE